MENWAMRDRAQSFDLHQLDAHEKKPSLLRRLFRSHSSDSMKKALSPPVPPKPSPLPSPTAGSGRRYLRVVRDDESSGEEYVNPYVIRKYNRDYWQNKNMDKSHSLDESRSASLSPPKESLPYTVSGHTILKNYHSLDDTCSISSSPVIKHATFKEEVEVVKYDIKGKCVFVIQEKLHDDEVSYDVCVLAELAGVDRPGCRDLMASVDSDITDVLSSLEVISETDERISSSCQEYKGITDANQFVMDEINNDVITSNTGSTDCPLNIKNNSIELAPESDKGSSDIESHLSVTPKSDSTSSTSDEGFDRAS